MKRKKEGEDLQNQEGGFRAKSIGRGFEKKKVTTRKRRREGKKGHER